MAKNKSTLQRIVALPFLWFIRLYQLFISPMLGQNCRFHPSCSYYTYTAIAEFGVLAGSWLACKRILKCHPYHPGGTDPVPKKQNKH